MVEVVFKKGKPVGPFQNIEWPGGNISPVYWIARKNFSLERQPDEVEILMSVDRNYEIYINSVCAVSHRNFFNGDEYIYAQHWSDGLKELLQSGLNEINIIVRSDPWRNKNYRCLFPLLLFEMDMRKGPHIESIYSDCTWEVSVINGWRRQIALGGNGTIHFEEIILPNTGKEMLPGIPYPAGFCNAHELDGNLDLPPVYLWNDRPVRTDVYTPRIMVSTGMCCFPDSAVEFDLRGSEARFKKKEPMIFHLDFMDNGGKEFPMATTALFKHRICFNGEKVFEYSGDLGRGQMYLPGYMKPAGKCATVKGINSISIYVFESPKVTGGFRFTACNMPSVLNSETWQDNEGKHVKTTIVELESADKIGSMAVYKQSGRVTGMADDSGICANKGEGCAFALLDMEKVVNARLSFNIRSETPGTIYIAYGFNTENGAVDCNRMKLMMVDILKVPAGKSIYKAFDIRTFRFLNFIFEGFDGQTDIFDIQTVEAVYLDDRDSKLITSDETVNTIWQASMRTAQLCGIELFVDNPEREHAQWHDPVLSLSTASYYICGERGPRKTGKILEEMALTRQTDGQIAGYAPGLWFPRLPLQCHMALYVISCHQYFMHTGDEDFTRRAVDTAVGIIEHWERHRSAEGLITDLHTVFTDWGSHIYSYGRGSKGPTGALTSMNAYYYGVLAKTSEMAEYLGKTDIARELHKILHVVRQKIIELLYDKKIGLYRDGVGDQLAERNISQTANALAVLFDIVPQNQSRKDIIIRAFKPAEGLDIIPANALFAWQAGSALFDAGCDELAMEWMCRGYGRMTDKNRPGTIWETWEPYASQCQGTGAAPLFLFSRYLAGVYPAQPGYLKIGIDPHPAGLKKLKAVLNTCRGMIQAEWEKDENGLSYRLILPDDLKGRDIVKNESVNLFIDNTATCSHI